jgi:hypothetical protein
MGSTSTDPNASGTTPAGTNTPYERTKSGRIISNTASDTKRGGKKVGRTVGKGAKKVGRATKKGAKKVGNKVEDIVD